MELQSVPQQKVEGLVLEYKEEGMGRGCLKAREGGKNICSSLGEHSCRPVLPEWQGVNMYRGTCVCPAFTVVYAQGYVNMRWGAHVCVCVHVCVHVCVPNLHTAYWNLHRRYVSMYEAHVCVCVSLCDNVCVSVCVCQVCVSVCVSLVCVCACVSLY